jgi:hypothetical protein
LIAVKRKRLEAVQIQNAQKNAQKKNEKIAQKIAQKAAKSGEKSNEIEHKKRNSAAGAQRRMIEACITTKKQGILGDG